MTKNKHFGKHVRQFPRIISIYIYVLILTENQLYYMCAENQFIRPPN